MMAAMKSEGSYLPSRLGILKEIQSDEPCGAPQSNHQSLGATHEDDVSRNTLSISRLHELTKVEGRHCGKILLSRHIFTFYSTNATFQT
jgi:hypothetical protein